VTRRPLLLHLKNERIGEMVNGGGGYQSSQNGNAAAEDGHYSSDEDYHGIICYISAT
jgi:hypothetical protein